MKFRKQLLLLAILAVIDFIVIWDWVKSQDPDPSDSIAILLLVPAVIIINLVLAAIAFAIKRRRYAKAFLINSITSTIIMYVLFNAGIERHQRIRYEGWNFFPQRDLAQPTPREY